MRRNGTWRSDSDVELTSFCSPATILAVLLILAVSGRFSGTGAVAGETNPSMLDQASLRYLPDDCRMLARIDPQALIRCEDGRRLAAGFCDAALFAPIDLVYEQIEQITVGARKFGDAENSQIVIILHCKQPPRTLRVPNPDSAEAEQVANRTVWIKAGPAASTSATCIAEDCIVLIGARNAVCNVLLRNGPAELPGQLERAYGQLDGEAGAAMAILTTDDILQSSAFGLPASFDLSQRIDALTAEIEFRPRVTLQLAALCCDEAAAQQLYGMGMGMWAFLESQNIQHSDHRVGQMLQSLESQVDGTVLQASVDLPIGMVSVTDSAAPNAIVPVQHFAAPTNFAVPPHTDPAQAHALPTTTPPVGVAPPASSLPGVKPYQAVLPSGTTPSSPAPTFGWDPYASGSPPTSSMPGYSRSPYGTPPASTSGYFPDTPNIAPPKPERVLPVIELSDVIRLSEAEVDEEIIVRHLGRHRLKHALTTDDLILLTERGVSTLVIQTVQVLDERDPAHAADSPSFRPAAPAAKPGVIR